MLENFKIHFSYSSWRLPPSCSPPLKNEILFTQAPYFCKNYSAQDHISYLSNWIVFKCILLKYWKKILIHDSILIKESCYQTNWLGCLIICACSRIESIRCVCVDLWAFIIWSLLLETFFMTLIHSHQVLLTTVQIKGTYISVWGLARNGQKPGWARENYPYLGKGIFFGLVPMGEL